MTSSEQKENCSRALILRRFPTIPAIVVLTLVYFAAGKFGLTLASLHQSVSPVWPPAGLALAALLLFGNRVFPGIFLGAFLVNLTTAGNLATSFGIATGNTFEAVCGAWLVNRFAGGTEAFDRVGNVFKFSLAAVFSTLVSPSIGLTSLLLGGFASLGNYYPVWLTWWQGDVTGVLVIAPLVLLWGKESTRRWTRRELAEVGLLFFTLIVLAEVSFGGWFPISARNYPISFLYGPFLVWLAFRFTPRETATGIFILASFAIWGTLHGRGPFVLATENQSLLILQTRTAILAITALALCAAIAERRRAEALIEEQKATVEAANRTKDNFLAMLSHELRTPLTPVVAALDSLRNESLDSSASKTVLEMMRRNIDLERRLIDDLLDLTRIAEGKLQLHLDSLDAHRAIANVVEICSSEIGAKKLQFSLDLRATEHFVAADGAKFQQIIWNLLKNAIKFTSENGRITLSSSNEKPESLIIAVADTGIGIEPEVMSRIFNRFEQGDLSFQRRFGGLGLGLTISKSLTEAHDGTLVAESGGTGRGARFSLKIKTIPAPKRAGALPVAPTQSRRSLRILLVDDHRDTSDALQKLLTRRGHNVAVANNMGSALQAAERAQFDLLVSDLGLPDGSGLELMSILHAKSGIRGIAISGFGMNGDLEKSTRAGFSHHLVKPVSLEHLEAAIEHAMSTPA